MRLEILDQGHRLRARLFMSMVRRLSGVEMTDVPKVLLYRPDLFGRPMLAIAAPAMRGRSFWTAGEREYMAAFTAQVHQCPYCVETHTELTRIASTGEIDAADSGSARPELAAVLPFLEGAARPPDDVALAHVRSVRAAGVPADAVVDALYVNLVWNIINRLANAFDFQLRDGQLLAGTRALHRLRYRFPRFLTSGGFRTARNAGSPHPRHRLVIDLGSSVFDSPARTEPAARAAAANGGPLPEPLASYAAKVRDASHQVTDDDIERLGAAGYSEDQIFEITVAAAVGAALRSLDAGLSAINAEDD